MRCATQAGQRRHLPGAALMADKGNAALMVMEGARPLWLFSERDYARNVIPEGRYPKDTQVKQVMSARDGSSSGSTARNGSWP